MASCPCWRLSAPCHDLRCLTHLAALCCGVTLNKQFVPCSGQLRMSKQTCGAAYMTIFEDELRLLSAANCSFYADSSCAHVLGASYDDIFGVWTPQSTATRAQHQVRTVDSSVFRSMLMCCRRAGTSFRSTSCVRKRDKLCSSL